MTTQERRDMFAAAALQGLALRNTEPPIYCYGDIVNMAWRYADAMLAAEPKEPHAA